MSLRLAAGGAIGPRVGPPNAVPQPAQADRLAIHNHADVHKVLPTGGVFPWPVLEQYMTGGTPNGPARQGLSWAFQILPYFEKNSIYGSTNQSQFKRGSCRNTSARRDAATSTREGES